MQRAQEGREKQNQLQFNLAGYEIHFYYRILQICVISGTSFYDNKTGEVWRVHVNMEMLVQLFIHCYMSTTRAALLHYVLTRTRDFFLIKRVKKKYFSRAMLYYYHW